MTGFHNPTVYRVQFRARGLGFRVLSVDESYRDFFKCSRVSGLGRFAKP